MTTTRIRPVSDLRNKYPDIEAELKSGPVYLTKNGYGTSVLVSTEFFDRTMSRVAMYEKIARSEAQLAAGKGISARKALADIREKYNV